MPPQPVRSWATEGVDKDAHDISSVRTARINFASWLEGFEGTVAKKKAIRPLRAISAPDSIATSFYLVVSCFLKLKLSNVLKSR